MTGATHMIVAVTICDLIGYTPIALIFAFLSHFFLDAMQHYDLRLFVKIRFSFTQSKYKGVPL